MLAAQTRWREAMAHIDIADHAYPGVKNAVCFVADRFGLELVEARVPWLLPGLEAVTRVFGQGRPIRSRAACRCGLWCRRPGARASRPGGR